MSLKIRKTSISINKRSNLTFDSMMEMLQVYPLLSIIQTNIAYTCINNNYLHTIISSFTY